MNTADRIYLQNLISAADLGIEGLAHFRGYLRAWLDHPNVGRLPNDVLDSVLADLAAAGLGDWLSPKAKQTLHRIVTGVE